MTTNNISTTIQPTAPDESDTFTVPVITSIALILVVMFLCIIAATLIAKRRRLQQTSILEER